MFNKCIFIGNLTKSVELRYTPQGTPVASFRIAINSKYKQGDELKQETLFMDITVFGKRGETVSKYLDKGQSCLVEGRLQESKWESDGQQKSKFQVIASDVRFLGGKGQKASPDSSPAPEEVTDLEPF